MLSHLAVHGILTALARFFFNEVMLSQSPKFFGLVTSRNKSELISAKWLVFIKAREKYADDILPVCFGSHSALDSGNSDARLKYCLCYFSVL